MTFQTAENTAVIQGRSATPKKHLFVSVSHSKLHCDWCGRCDKSPDPVCVDSTRTAFVDPATRLRYDSSWRNVTGVAATIIIEAEDKLPAISQGSSMHFAKQKHWGLMIYIELHMRLNLSRFHVIVLWILHKVFASLKSCWKFWENGGYHADVCILRKTRIHKQGLKNDELFACIKSCWEFWEHHKYSAYLDIFLKTSTNNMSKVFVILFRLILCSHISEQQSWSFNSHRNVPLI